MPKYRERVIPLEVKTLNELLRKLQLIEESSAFGQKTTSESANFPSGFATYLQTAAADKQRDFDFSKLENVIDNLSKEVSSIKQSLANKNENSSVVPKGNFRNNHNFGMSHADTRSADNRPICSFCGKINHTAFNCRARIQAANNFSANNHAQSSSQQNKQDSVCSICYNVGHLPHECRFLGRFPPPNFQGNSSMATRGMAALPNQRK